MSTNIRWDFPKDPNDKAWYGIPFEYDLDSVSGVTIMDIGPIDFSKIGHDHYRTPGDMVANATDVEAVSVQLSDDHRTVMMWLIHGKPMRKYAVQAHIKDTGGNELNRTAVLEVHGQ